MFVYWLEITNRQIYSRGFMEETRTHYIESVGGGTERLEYEFCGVEKKLKLRGRGHESIFVIFDAIS